MDTFLKIIMVLLICLVLFVLGVVIFAESDKIKFKKEHHCEIVVPHQTKSQNVTTMMLVGKVMIPQTIIVKTYLYQCDNGQYYF